MKHACAVERVQCRKVRGSICFEALEALYASLRAARLESQMRALQRDRCVGASRYADSGDLVERHASVERCVGWSEQIDSARRHLHTHPSTHTC